jgi:flavin reductase (DIM6/NTAB) family NADH-FMN oxidoreductase RutF
MDVSEFKASVGKYPTGVTVISTKHQNLLYGFTANSFTSVSLFPQLISFCLNKTSGSLSAFKSEEYFGISILASDQSSTSLHFASRINDKFNNVNYSLGKLSGCPLIEESICWIECSKYRQLECGDHYIFIGEVLGAKILNDKSPLLYFSKSYQEIK